MRDDEIEDEPPAEHDEEEVMPKWKIDDERSEAWVDQRTKGEV